MIRRRTSHVVYDRIFLILRFERAQTDVFFEFGEADGGEESFHVYIGYQILIQAIEKSISRKGRRIKKNSAEGLVPFIEK